MFHYFWKAMLQRNQRAIQMFIGYDSGVKLCIIKHVDSTEKIIFFSPKEKKCKKAKWLSEEALQIAEKRRDAKGKGEKGRYIHLNVEFQRIARKDKKAFLSDQCKDIEENNRMGKTR